MKPYRVMRAALDHCGRDIVFSLCQYGMGDVWTWGAEVGGNCWRTTGDIVDNWGSMSGIGFGQNGHERYAGPGHWNDPDMLVVGKVGWGPALHPTRLKPNEQITHITLWCLLVRPAADRLRHGAAWTTSPLALLTNDEVLAINQDPLGKPAGPARAGRARREVWARPLADGTWAVGLFNRGTSPVKVKVTWSDLKLRGPQPSATCGSRKTSARRRTATRPTVPSHGAVLLKVGPAVVGRPP